MFSLCDIETKIIVSVRATVFILLDAHVAEY